MQELFGIKLKDIKVSGEGILSSYAIVIMIYSLAEHFAYTKELINCINAGLIEYIPGQPTLRSILYILGIPVIIYLLIRNKENLLRYDCILLGVYILTMITAAFFVDELSILENLVDTYEIISLIIIFYFTAKLISFDACMRFLKRMIISASVLWGIACIVSMIYYFSYYQGTYLFGNIKHFNVQGFDGIRLYGAFQDTNYAAVFSLIIVIGILYLIRTEKLNKILTIVLYASMIFCVLFMVLSFSRTCYMAQVAFCITLALMYTYRRNGLNKLGIKNKLLSTIILSLMLIVSLIILNLLVYYICSFIASFVIPGEVLGRDLLNGEDISSGRFEIWENYLSLWTERPLIGYSAEGTLPYAIANHPDMLISEIEISQHSMYIRALTQSGIIGTVSLGLFILIPNIRALRDGFKCSFKWPLYLCFLILCEVICLVTGLFYNVGVTHVLFVTEILWFSLGAIQKNCCN